MINYKKIIRSRKMRLSILRFLRFVPDSWMIRIQYRMKTGRKLDLQNPKRFTEKLQWYKLYYRNDLMPQCVDKFDVREYVKRCGLESILNVCYGVFDTPDEIDFSALPDQFVLKDTLGSGGNSVIICRDKSQLDIPAATEQMSGWIKTNHRIRSGGREWPYYSGKPHRIIAEKYIDSDPAEGGLIDYKFICFCGKAEYLYVVADRSLGNGAGFGIYDASYQNLNYFRTDERPLTREIPKPAEYERMLEIAERLSAPFPHARIDLYDQNGIILFGEITFFDGSGYMMFEPDEFDFILGEHFSLPNRNIWQFECI